MNKLKIVSLFAMIIALSGCGAGVTIKDATGFVAGQVVSNATDSDTVSVHDARINKTTETIAVNNNGSIEQVKFKPEQHNWNNSKQEVVTNNTVSIPVTNQQTSQQIQQDKTYTLFTFFFAMMVMGMLGAGIIGLIEAFSGRNSLSTEQAVKTAPIHEVKPRIKLNKDGTTKDV